MKTDGHQACAFFLGRGYSWLEANAMCAKLGGHLPVIQSAQENKDIYDLQVKENKRLHIRIFPLRQTLLLL